MECLHLFQHLLPLHSRPISVQGMSALLTNRDRGYDLVDLYDMDSAADLSSSCYSVLGFMAVMAFNADGI